MELLGSLYERYFHLEIAYELQIRHWLITLGFHIKSGNFLGVFKKNWWKAKLPVNFQCQRLIFTKLQCWPNLYYLAWKFPITSSWRLLIKITFICINCLSWSFKLELFVLAVDHQNSMINYDLSDFVIDYENSKMLLTVKIPFQFTQRQSNFQIKKF
jgi:hypothetical protein